MKNVVLHIGYDGTRFLGWQKTNLDQVTPSIEYVLEETLEQILQQKVSLQAAGRTDRGVHAEGQVVNFFADRQMLDFDKLQHSLNSLLPPDIRVFKVFEAEDPAFHATLSSKAKQYKYRITTARIAHPFLRTNHWHLPVPLNRENMLLAADILLGEHDFAAFKNFRKGKDYNDTVRTLMQIDFEDPSTDILHIKILANNFLYKMARNIVGTLVYVGMGKLSCGHMQRLLEGASRPDAGITAPAHGLSLYKVFYTLPLLSTTHTSSI